MAQALKFWRGHKGAFASLVAVLSIAVAIVTTVWSLADAVWWRPLPFPISDRLVSLGFVGWGPDSRRWRALSTADYLDLHEHQRAVSSMAAYESARDLFLPTGNGPIALDAIGATTSFFEVLRVTPLLGRTFTTGDGATGAPVVAVISRSLWVSQFGSDDSIIGKERELVSRAGVANRRVTIVGVLPFDIPYHPDRQPANLIVALPDAPSGFERVRHALFERVPIARLADGVSVSAAAERLTTTLRQIDRDFPNRAYARERTASLLPLQDALYGSAKGLLALLGAASVLVLAVACANSAGALLAISSRRGREFAVRTALGAGRLQLVRSALAESLIIAGAAAVAALVLARWLLAGVVAIAPASLPRVSEARLDLGAFALAILTAVGCGVLLGLLPALVRERQTIVAVLQAGGTSTMSRRALGYRRLLLAGQIAIVLSLLTASGLVIRSLWDLLSQPLGFDIARVLTAEVTPTKRYFETPARYQQLIEDLQREALSAPGSREAAVTFDAPLANINSQVRVDFPDGTNRFVAFKQVSGGFFALMGSPLLTGRDFRRSDHPTGRFVIVNESFARTYFGGVRQAVNREVRLWMEAHEIVGVVGDVREGRLTDPLTPVIYPVLSAAKWTPGMLHLVTRERGDLRLAQAQVLAAVNRADPSVHVRVQPLSVRLQNQTATARFQVWVLSALAAFTLLLALLGIHTLVSQLSAHRARELALRSALGAEPRALVILMVRTVLSATAVGVLAGTALSWMVARSLAQFLFRTSPLDGVAWTGAALCLVVAATLAAWLPARTAGRVDPALLLRQE